MNDNFSTIGLYEHNIEPYKKVKNKFDDGEKVVGIVRATGTGKTYIGLQLAYDYKNKKILYVVPSNGIIEHIQEIISNNPNLDLERDFSNLEFRTYHSFVNMNREELENLDVDLMILDEFHHIGAPVWGERIKYIIDTHKNIQVFGMTAYTVRDRGTIYERDMANPETNELFSNKIVSRYDLTDALVDGVLPSLFAYKSMYYINADIDEIKRLEEKVENIKEENEKVRCKSLLEDCKKQIINANNVGNLVRNNINKDSKIIYFCPPGSIQGINDIKTIMKEFRTWVSDIKDEDIVFYMTTSEMGVEGVKNREAFYQDKDLEGNNAKGKLRVMFAINQYNEGIHAPSVDRVIMGRATTSDIVYFEQLGRALSVNTDTKQKYENYSKDALLYLAKSKKLNIPEYFTKEEIVAKLAAPVVIDLTDNFEFIMELENNFKGEIKKRRINNSINARNARNINLNNYSFDVEMVNENLYQMLKYLKDRLSPQVWDEMYGLAKNYYDKHGDLEVSLSFRTKNGVDEDFSGKNLGIWVRTQRDFYNKGILRAERKEKLDKIGMRYEANKFDLVWNGYYEIAKKYYEHHSDLEVPTRFRTKNGYDYDKDGKKLGNWIRTQRVAYKDGTLSKDRKKQLDSIGMRFVNRDDIAWKETYKLAQKYYEHHNDLEVPGRFRTRNGYDYDKDGYGLGIWIKNQRDLERENRLSSEYKELLDKIKMRFTIRNYDEEWQNMYNLAKNYYDHYGNLKISQEFKTNNGIDKDKDGKALGLWIVTQRIKFQKGKMPEERKKLLDSIGMRFETANFEAQWLEMFNLAKVYYEYNGNTEIPSKFITKNGYEHDDSGKKIGRWLINQRTDKKTGKLSKERSDLLESIGVRFENKRNITKVKRK